MRKTDKNDLKSLADRLKYYNEWRRGSDTEQPNPTQIGRDIDAAVEIIKDEIEKSKQEIAQAATEAERKRTITQNKALHVYFELLATALNDAGLDMKRTLKPEVDIPWSAVSVKEHLWRPIQKAIIDKQSTKEASTAEYGPVYETLNRHTSDRFGISIPWPSRDQRFSEEALRYYDEINGKL